MNYEKKEWTVADKQAMDIKAESARRELIEWLKDSPDGKTIDLFSLSVWFKRWKEGAGLKRLAKVVIQVGQMHEPEQEEE